MHVWLDLISRELLFLAIVGALGSWPATFLPEAFDRAARVAMAPLLGLCVGVCVTVTLVYFFPASDTEWLLVPLALLSLGGAARRTRGTWRWPGRRAVAQLAIVTIVILASFNYPLALRHTIGPDGGYGVADTNGYVSETNGEAHVSIRRAEQNRAPYADLSVLSWSVYADGYQQLDISALEANINQLVGFGSTDTDSPFLIAVLLVGALGVFAVVRRVSGRPTWAAVTAACLFGGPLFVELFMDGSQAAISGSSLLAATVAVGCDALWSRKVSDLVLFALLLAGLQTIYPLFLPPIVLAAVATVGFLVVRRLLHGWPSWREAKLLIGQIALVCVLAAAFTPVAFSRNARYWGSLLTGSMLLSDLPKYVLPFNVLPGWVLQTREFYGLVNLTDATAGQLLLGAMVPLVLVASVVFAARRYREAVILLVVAGCAALLAAYTWFSRDCTYCVQRNLIPVAALAPVALGIGIAAIATLRWRGGIALATALGVALIVVVGHEGIIERQRLDNGSYLLDPQNREAIAALPKGQGDVDLEGYAQGSKPPMELPLVYNLVDEKRRGHVSLPTDRDDYNGLAYLGGVEPLGPSFDPNYTYVVTRLDAISANRRLIARYGPIALEQRTHVLDVTVTGGVLVPFARADPSGTAWVNPGRPLHFLVAGRSPTGQVWLSVELEATGPVTVPRQPGLSMGRRGNTVTVCLHASGTGPVHEFGFMPLWVPEAGPPPAEPYEPPNPPVGLRLVGMQAGVTPCHP